MTRVTVWWASGRPAASPTGRCMSQWTRWSQGEPICVCPPFPPPTLKVFKQSRFDTQSSSCLRYRCWLRSPVPKNPNSRMASLKRYTARRDREQRSAPGAPSTALSQSRSTTASQPLQLSPSSPLRKSNGIVVLSESPLILNPH